MVSKIIGTVDSMKDVPVRRVERQQKNVGRNAGKGSARVIENEPASCAQPRPGPSRQSGAEV
jgi:hypothetical protein